MRCCILIGGGHTGNKNRETETQIIDEEIVHLTKKSNPIFLYIGLANSHADSKYDEIKKIYQALGCNTKHLKRKNLEYNIELSKDKIKEADIIYIGGGDTIRLLDSIKTYKIEDDLKEAYNRGCIMVGKSAGAILLSKEGFSDSYILRGEKEHYEFVEGLSFVNISICPHYHEDSKKIDELEKAIKSDKKEVYGIDNQAALILEENKVRTIKTSEEHNIYKCYYQDKYIEKIIE